MRTTPIQASIWITDRRQGDYRATLLTHGTTMWILARIGNARTLTRRLPSDGFRVVQ